MRKIRQVLRLSHELELSHREIARTCAVDAGTVSRYLRRTEERGLGWPLPAELDDAALEAQLFLGLLRCTAVSGPTVRTSTANSSATG